MQFFNLNAIALDAAQLILYKVAYDWAWHVYERKRRNLFRFSAPEG